jgi:ribonuclease HI
MSTLVCFTDGACFNNGKKTAKASFAVVWPDLPEYNYSQLLEGVTQTNNRAEYSGFIKAFQIADIIDSNREKELIVYTDSMLLINSVTKWMKNWKKKDWKKSNGEIVLNIDLLKTIDFLTQTRKFAMHHVRAHTKNTDWMSLNNKKVDELAKKALM